MKIQVTKEDIAFGHRHNPCECPVALACKRALEGYVMVTTTVVSIQSETGDFRDIKVPKSVTRFVEAYDARKFVKPFSFILKGV